MNVIIKIFKMTVKLLVLTTIFYVIPAMEKDGLMVWTDMSLGVFGIPFLLVVIGAFCYFYFAVRPIYHWWTLYLYVMLILVIIVVFKKYNTFG